MNRQINKYCQLVLWLFTCFLVATSASASYVVTDSFGKHKFESPPKRIVVTDWTLLEQLVELGIKPVGAPELKLYQHYVVQPGLPDGIEDIGLRRAPNIEKIRALKPDVIIVGTDQKKLARPFSRISRVMFYKSFSDKYRTNGKKSRTRFLQIADLFQKREYAERKLKVRDAALEKIKQDIALHFNGNLPAITVVRFSSDRKVLVYGENSMVMHTMNWLGLAPAVPSSRSKWGEREITIDKLNEINEGVLLYVEPVDTKRVLTSKVWLQLPLVVDEQVSAMSPAWSYGGAMSVFYTARAIQAALKRFPQEK